MTKKLTRQLILTALFAAIIFLGTQLLRITITKGVMIHIGNALVMVSFLCLGTKYSMIAASVGLGLFDLLNDYITYAPQTIIESLFVVAVLHIVYKLLKEKDTLTNVIILSISAGLAKVVIKFIFRYAQALFITGNSTAIFTIIPGMTNTFITSCITAVVSPFIYFAIKKYVPNMISFQK